ncbi:MAG: hypothetical protein ACK4IK_03440 [Bacteroidia bacterium]
MVNVTTEGVLSSNPLITTGEYGYFPNLKSSPIEYRDKSYIAGILLLLIGTVSAIAILYFLNDNNMPKKDFDVDKN